MRHVHRSLRFLPLITAAAMSVGCSQNAAPDAPSGSGPDAEETCPAGQVASPVGGCMPVGIQGCAPVFLGADGLCHPALGACEPGTIPKFDEGCIQVGIPRCAAIFLEDDGLCHPSRAKCPEGTFPVPQEGCVPIDGPLGCGTGTWGNIAAKDGDVYVDPAATGTDGDGSRERPLTTIAAALARVERGHRIALAAGVYDEPITITKPIEIAGRCPSLVRVQGVRLLDQIPAVVLVREPGGAVTLRGLQLAGAGIGIIAGGGDVTVEETWIRGALMNGLIAFGASTRATMVHALVEETAVGPAGEGIGVVAGQGAKVVVDRCALADNQWAGAAGTDDGTELEVRGSLVEGGPAHARSEGGGGVVVEAKSRVTVSESAVVDSRGTGLRAAGAGASLVATSVLVEATRPDAAGSGGNGVEVALEAAATLDGSVVGASSPWGVYVNRNGDVTVAGSLLRDSRTFSVYLGSGVMVEGAHARLTSTTLADNASAGLVVLGRSTFEGTGNLVEANGLAPADADNAAGIVIASSKATLRSNAIARNVRVGLQAASHGAEVLLAENLFEGTAPVPDTEVPLGAGMLFVDDVHATLQSNLVDDNRSFGLGALRHSGTGPTISASGDLIQNTRAVEASNALLLMSGVFASDATVSLRAAVIRDSDGAGVFVIGATRSEVHDSLIDGVTERPYIDGSARPMRLGDGAVALGPELDLQGTRVTHCARVGITYYSSTGRIGASVVSGNKFGALLGGSTQPVIDADTRIEENAEQDIVHEGDLAVPEKPAVVP